VICGSVQCNQRLGNNMENEDKPKQERKQSIATIRKSIICEFRFESDSSGSKTRTFANGLDQTVGQINKPFGN
jgi:hypothetical protein